MQIPWWAKLGAKLILSRLPFGYAVWQRLGLFRHGSMDTSGYAIRVFHSHVERAGFNHKLRGRTVLELGPGDSIATAVIAAAHGARAILIDSGRFVRTDTAPYIELERALHEKGLAPPRLSGCRDIEEILSRCRARYMTNGLASLGEVQSASVDLIFSHAVLEHVRKRDFAETMRGCRRVLKPGGVCSHQIDLRDHLSGGLNNRRFSDKVWESDVFANSGFYTNRISFSEMPVLFEQAGFTVDICSVRRWAASPIKRNQLAREFRGLSDEDLCVSGFDVLLR